jgi:hypothetical protein
MRLPLWIAGLWPGLARAWTLRRWEGLALAVGFGAALSAALIATFVWRRWPAADAMTATVAWGLVVGLWVLGIAWLREDWRTLRGGRQVAASPEADALLREAQHQYMKGHWLEAETLAMKLTHLNPTDVEARLLLASVQRRSQQWNEARRGLIELRKEAGAALWLLEIDSELRQIEESQTQTTPNRRAKAA